MKNKENPKDVVIGFDFGSSCTKVVVQFPTYDKRIAINFENLGHKSNPFLLPTIIYIDKSGIFSIKNINQFNIFRDFKIKLINESNTICFPALNVKYIDIAIAYIALTLKIVKKKVINSGEIPTNNIKWHFNLGIPSACHNDSEIIKIFKKVADSAWYLARKKCDISIDYVKESQDEKNWQNYSTTHRDNINVVSEIAAEVVGYAKSSERRDGLYILIDIGSRTIDISSFNLHKENGDDKYPFLTADIMELGAFYLHEERIKIFNNNPKLKPFFPKNDAYLNDSVAPLPKLEEYFRSKINSNFIESKILNDFYWKTRKFIGNTFYTLRKKDYPNAPEWDEKKGLPVFVCGGGKSIDFYINIINSLDIDYIHKHIKSKIKFETIIVPSNIGYPFIDKDRIAVAHGLSFPYYDIGIIKSPSELKKIQNQEEPTTEDEIEIVGIQSDEDYY
jgi:hypothetical protein